MFHSQVTGWVSFSRVASAEGREIDLVARTIWCSCEIFTLATGKLESTESFGLKIWQIMATRYQLPVDKAAQIHLQSEWKIVAR